jgi:Helix-turn-helix
MTVELKHLLAGSDWEVGSADQFLGLSSYESTLIDIKLALAQAAKKTRVQNDLSQIDLAKRMKSSQSRIAKIEAADASVSIDLTIRALLASGAGRSDIASALR